MLEKLIKKLARKFRTNPHLHFRQRDLKSPAELVDLMDRFVGDDMRYPLEWDDFISWSQENPNIEDVRLRLGEAEHLLFSNEAGDRERYIQLIVGERNRMAALLGISQR